MEGTGFYKHKVLHIQLNPILWLLKSNWSLKKYLLKFHLNGLEKDCKSHVNSFKICWKKSKVKTLPWWVLVLIKVCTLLNGKIYFEIQDDGSGLSDPD